MNLYVWGTGRLVGKVIGRYVPVDQIKGFIDSNKKCDEYMGRKVLLPQELLDVDYDAVLVINLYSKEIYEQCIDLGITLDKVIFTYENFELKDLNQDYDFIKSVVGEEYAQIIQNRYHIVRGVEAYDTTDIQTLVRGGYGEKDYVRIKCFELVVKEIRKRKLRGAVAEVGVFRGEFAQYINAAFPNSKLYLFDTFDGFDANEALNEVKNGNCTDSFVSAYKDTNVKKVIEKMQHLEQIEIKQGYFPESLNGLEDIFKFVSIDVDFEESIYHALEYFYPRMVKGGYIFVHDYNSSLRGVEKAVDRYESRYEFLNKMPLCDANGTLVIMK